MPFVEANGERIHYHVEGAGPAVMLLHSMGANAYMWRDQVAALIIRARDVVAAGRPPCRFCGRPLESRTGDWCACRN